MLFALVSFEHCKSDRLSFFQSYSHLKRVLWFFQSKSELCLCIWCLSKKKKKTVCASGFSSWLLHPLGDDLISTGLTICSRWSWHSYIRLESCLTCIQLYDDNPVSLLALDYLSRLFTRWSLGSFIVNEKYKIWQAVRKHQTPVKYIHYIVVLLFCSSSLLYLSFSVIPSNLHFRLSFFNSMSKWLLLIVFFFNVNFWTFSILVWL